MVKDSNKKIIGCDADGVLTDMCSYNLRMGRKVFKREAVRPDSYSLEEVFDVSDLSKAKKYLKAFHMYHNYCKNEPPREGVAEVISELSEQGYGFYSITARKFATGRNLLGTLARKWFTNWLHKFGITFSGFHFCNEENSRQDKLLACRKLGVEVMIEDKPDNVEFLAKNGVRVLMFDAPYNRNIEGENIIRVSSWYEIRDRLQSLKPSEITPFSKLDHEEVTKLSNDEKVAYFQSYKSHLRSMSLDSEVFKKGDRRFRHIFRLIKPFARLFYRTKVIGADKVPFQDGFIIASNHNDSYDQYRLGLALGNRPFVGYAAKEIAKSFRGRLFAYTGLGIFIDRHDADDKQRAAELMASYVAHGRISLIFPEGTRKNRTPEGHGIFQNRFRMGTASLAQKTGTAILPVAINGFGRDSYVRFGEMLYVSPLDSVTDKTRELELIIAKMSMENIISYHSKHSKRIDIEKEKAKYKKYVKEVCGEE